MYIIRIYNIYIYNIYYIYYILYILYIYIIYYIYIYIIYIIYIIHIIYIYIYIYIIHIIYIYIYIREIVSVCQSQFRPAIWDLTRHGGRPHWWHVRRTQFQDGLKLQTMRGFNLQVSMRAKLSKVFHIWDGPPYYYNSVPLPFCIGCTVVAAFATLHLDASRTSTSQAEEKSTRE